jgi:hypothetical protein
MALKDMERVAPSGVDVLERGKDAEGNSIGLDRRLFMQLLAFGGCVDSGAVAAALAKASSDASFALYEDLNDPDGIAILACHEEPGFFVGEWRQMLKQAPLADLQPKPEMTMFGRTYSLGYEQDLEETLIGRPRGKVVNPKLPWAIWYPLRRDGAFEQLPAEEQRTILMEHGWGRISGWPATGWTRTTMISRWRCWGRTWRRSPRLWSGCARPNKPHNI